MQYGQNVTPKYHALIGYYDVSTSVNLRKWPPSMYFSKGWPVPHTLSLQNWNKSTYFDAEEDEILLLESSFFKRLGLFHQKVLDKLSRQSR